MTVEEINEKLTPGKPDPSSIPGRDWYPSGKADGVIFRAVKPQYKIANGEYVAKSFVKIAGESVPLHDKVAMDTEAKAFRYVKPSSEADRTNGIGLVADIGVINHLGGFVDKLTKHFPCLKKERDAGYNLNHFMAHDQIGKDAMKPEIFANLKVVPVEEGIFVVIYDPLNEIPK